MKLRRRQPLRRQSINRLIPNILTLLALCAGLTAMRFALEQHYQMAVIAIVVAAVLDGLDGRIARLIGATSKFGAELDSLSDFVCFGVAPAVMLYLWVMHGGGRFGWAVVLLYAVCTALRLARFNTALDDTARPAWSFNYFTGVPAPAGAGLAILPMIASFEIGPGWLDHPWLIDAWTIVVSGLMVSRIPTFAFKRLRVPHWMVLPVLLAVGIMAAGMAAEPWITLMGIGVAYIVSLPLAWRATARARRQPPAEPKPAEPPAPLVSISGGRGEPR